MMYLPRDKIYLLAGLLGAVGIVTVAYGFAYRFSGPALFRYFEVWSWAFLLCLVALARGTLLFPTEPDARIELPRWITPLVTAATLLSSFYFWLPTRLALTAAIAVIVVCAGLYRLQRDRACIPFLLIAGFALCCYAVARIPIDRNTADMLPVIADANNFLLSGHDPYAQTYTNLFVYLPVQWLVFLPPVLAGIDPRSINLVGFAVVGLLIVWLVRSGRLHEVVLLGIGPIMLSRTSVEMILRGQVWPVWALLAGFAATLLSPGKFWPAILLGLLLATQQPMVALAALTGVWLLFHRGFASALRVTLIAATVFAVIMAPWLILRPTLLFDLYIRLPQVFAQNHVVDLSWDLSEVSILDLLQNLGLKSVRAALQAATVVAGMLYLAVSRNVRLGTFLCTIGLVYLIAISLNVQVFKYYYYPGFLLLATGLAVPHGLAGIGGNRSPRQSGGRA
jgi:hypothetical protein